MVNDFFFVNRCPQTLNRILVLEIKVKNSFRLHRVTLRLGHNRFVHIFLRNFNLRLIAGFCEQQPEFHAADGDIFIFFEQVFFFLALFFFVKLIVFLGVFILFDNRFIFQINQFRRNIKLISLVQSVKQRTFQFHFGGGLIIFGNPFFHRFLEFVQIFLAHGFGKFVIDFRPLDFSDFFNRGNKQRFLTGQIFGVVVFWESRFNVNDFAGFFADKLVFITRNKRIGADFQRISLAFAARKFNTVNGADKINNRYIAFCRYAVFFNFYRIAAALGHILQSFFNFFFRNFGYNFFKLNAGKIFKFDFRHNFH